MKHCSSCGSLVTEKIPDGDNRHRWVCVQCNTIHYQNPRIVVGCVAEQDGKILLCRRAIEPRYGYWTVPAGFMELGETMEQGAARETLEEACADVEIGHLFASVDVIEAGQVHVFLRGTCLAILAPVMKAWNRPYFGKRKSPGPTSRFAAASLRSRNISKTQVKTTACICTRYSRKFGSNYSSSDASCSLRRCAGTYPLISWPFSMTMAGVPCSPTSWPIR